VRCAKLVLSEVQGHAMLWCYACPFRFAHLPVTGLGRELRRHGEVMYTQLNMHPADSVSSEHISCDPFLEVFNVSRL
jgi:hypothetical protein